MQIVIIIGVFVVLTVAAILIYQHRSSLKSSVLGAEDVNPVVSPSVDDDTVNGNTYIIVDDDDTDVYPYDYYGSYGWPFYGTYGAPIGYHRRWHGHWEGGRGWRGGGSRGRGGSGRGRGGP